MHTTWSARTVTLPWLVITLMEKVVSYAEPKEILKVPLYPFRSCKLDWMVLVDERLGEERKVEAVKEETSWRAACRSERKPAAKCTPESTSILL